MAGWPPTWKSWGIRNWSGEMGKVVENVFLPLVCYHVQCYGNTSSDAECIMIRSGM